MDANTCSKSEAARRRPTTRRRRDRAARGGTWPASASRISSRCATNMRRARGSCLTEARVVERRHHRLARAGRRDEQVAVVPAALGTARSARAAVPGTAPAATRWAQRESGRAVALGLGAREELLAIVGDEVAAVPVGLEDRRDLVDDARVAGARRPNVPLEAADLRRVRQVRRADVGGRETGTPVEQPRLRVESGAGLVVGDANIGAEVAKLIERPRFRRSRVRRRQHPNLASRLTVGTERVEHRRDPAAPDERHDDIDPVGRVDLRQTWLPTRGSPGAFVSRVVSRSGMSGAGIASAGRPATFQQRSAGHGQATAGRSVARVFAAVASTMTLTSWRARAVPRATR